jgi:hypothetical protein
MATIIIVEPNITKEEREKRWEEIKKHLEKVFSE